MSVLASILSAFHSSLCMFKTLCFQMSSPALSIRSFHGFLNDVIYYIKILRFFLTVFFFVKNSRHFIGPEDSMPST
jgi:hypothetical protein